MDAQRIGGAQRIEYDAPGLHEAELADDPMVQFETWLSAAVAADVEEANTMILSTITADGMPAGRAVLLKTFDEHGLTFFTNYASDKGTELARHPMAALTFMWQQLHRQVRVLGSVSKVSVAESETYFASRPRGSQLAARASSQSAPVESRQILQESYEREREAFDGQLVPRPDTWGGYRVYPHSVEFWQGQPNRLHDRVRYLRDGQSWTRERLCP